ncbi:hypothetical protein WN943_006716 [Citrus x changshan-huyou]
MRCHAPVGLKFLCTVDGDVAAYQWTKNFEYGTCITLDYFQPNRVTVHPSQTALLFIRVKPRCCSSESNRVTVHQRVAVDLGRAIAEGKLHLLYGGGDRGLSKLVSEAAFVRGSQVLGIIPKALKPLGWLPDSPIGEELVVSGDLATLEALITFASWAYLNIHKKPIAKKLFICAHTANELLDLLQPYKPKPDPMNLVLDWATDNDGSNSRKKCKLDLTLRL